MISYALFFILILSCWNVSDGNNRQEKVKKFFERGNHTDIWAVLIDSHPPQYNERAGSGAVRTIYTMLKKFGVTDDRIILMAGNPAACSSLNPLPGQVLAKIGLVFNVNEGVEVDYKEDEVTVTNLLQVLTDRHPPGTSRSKRLLSNSKSNVLIFISAHGNNVGMAQFRDESKMYPKQLLQAIQEMRRQGRYNELLVISLTCYAGSFCRRLKGLENVLCFGSVSPTDITDIYTSSTYSPHGKNVQYAYSPFVAHLAKYLDEVFSAKNNHSIQDFVSSCTRENCGKNMYSHGKSYPRKLDNVPLTNFFKPDPTIEYFQNIEMPDFD